VRLRHQVITFDNRPSDSPAALEVVHVQRRLGAFGAKQNIVYVPEQNLTNVGLQIPDSRLQTLQTRHVSSQLVT
jgi:hypothetical protein